MFRDGLGKSWGVCARDSSEEGMALLSDKGVSFVFGEGTPERLLTYPKDDKSRDSFNFKGLRDIRLRFRFYL